MIRNGRSRSTETIGHDRRNTQPKRIQAEIFPYYEARVEDLLEDLAKRDFIQRYVADGRKYIQISKFAKHQNPHLKEKQSTIPAPSEHHASTVLAPETPELAKLIPDSLIPDSLIPDSAISDFPTPSPDSSGSLRSSPSHAPNMPTKGNYVAIGAGRGRRSPKSGNGLATAPAREAYCAAYAVRYGVPPVLNAKVNSQICQVVERLGIEESAAVTAFYVRSNNGRYVASGHSVGMLLMDAEKLRTEWARGRSVTQTEVRLNDQTAARGNVFGALIAEAKEGTHG